MEIRPQHIEKEAYTAAEVAVMFGLSTGTLANWRSQRVGPVFFRLGGRRIVYFRSDLDTWTRQYRVLTSDDRAEGG